MYCTSAFVGIQHTISQRYVNLNVFMPYLALEIMITIQNKRKIFYLFVNY